MNSPQRADGVYVLMRRRDSVGFSVSVCVYQSLVYTGEGGVVQSQTYGTSLCAMFKQADLKAGDLRKRGSPQLFSKSLEMRVAEGCQGALLEKERKKKKKKLSSLSGSVQIVCGLVEFHE